MIGGALSAGLAGAGFPRPVAGQSPPAPGPSPLAAPPRLSPVGVQLYTVRAQMQADVEATLARVARIGYREVEFAGYFRRTPAEIRSALRANGLTAPSSHIPLEMTRDAEQWDRLLDDARVMGHRYLVVAWTPADLRRTLDDWRRIGELFNRAGERAHGHGIQFAYHNHDYEFVELDGRLPFDVLLESSDPNLVQVEMDLFWIRKGGQDPLVYFERWPERFPMVHVKDMTGDGRMVDVGAGVIDWCRILGRARQAGIRHYFVEHDEPPDAFASITASYQALRALDTGARACR